MSDLLEEEEFEAHPMDEVITNLWIGNLSSAQDEETLKAHNIHSIVSAMRGKISIHETFIRHQVNIDDTEDADILCHLVAAITFIQAELDKGRGVLVHCQAGLSRSATIVAAYLMYSQDLNANAALEVIKKSRPNVQPNDGFLEQLEVFHNASFKVSRRDKATRMFYLERVVQDVLNGDGSVETDMFAKFPRTPSDSTPATPNGPRRRIRCKMCRQELATREHMLDHGQLGPATPASASAFSPAASRRPSMHDSKSLSPLNTISPPTSRRPSSSRPLGPMSPLSPSSTFTTISRRPSQQEPSSRPRLGSNSDNRPLKSSLLALDGAGQLGQDLSDLLSLSESALEGGDSTDEEPQQIIETERLPPRAVAGQQSGIPPVVARRLSSSSGVLAHPSDIAAQLSSHPKLAALRLPSTGPGIMPLSPGASATSPTRSGPQSPPILARKAPSFVPISPPILANPKCSGYFVEPMKWMEPFLEEGQMSGKILCPNKKCGVKLGNYDWAGVCCSCKEWVVPGFCIHRSKVDEVV